MASLSLAHSLSLSHTHTHTHTHLVTCFFLRLPGRRVLVLGCSRRLRPPTTHCSLRYPLPYVRTHTHARVCLRVLARAVARAILSYDTITCKPSVAVSIPTHHTPHTTDFLPLPGELSPSTQHMTSGVHPLDFTHLSGFPLFGFI
jgi:hypothetical protein